MKVVILAGGLGTRLSEETGIRPKPMVEIGDKPILWHIMKLYSSFGVCEFIICAGYKGHMIKEYFASYYMNNTSVTFNLENNSMEMHAANIEPWKVTVVDTGDNTMTGGRLKRIQEFVGNERFMLTYGDGVADIDINKLQNCHQDASALATMTVVKPTGRFGVVKMDQGGKVTEFHEKPNEDENWINGGFFVLEPEVFDLLKDDTSIWEREPLESLARDGQLNAYKHHGFWRPMDTLKDKKDLNELWNAQQAEWKIW